MGETLRREVGAEEIGYLRISRLTKKFGAFTALDDISLEIVEGEQGFANDLMRRSPLARSYPADPAGIATNIILIEEIP